MSTENYDLADEDISTDLTDVTVLLVEDELVQHWNREAQEQPWYASYAWSEWASHSVVEEVEGLGSVEVVEVETGKRCDDDARLVFRISNDEGDVVRHFAVDGVNCEEVGVYWGGELYEVVPEEVLVTRYTRL